MHKFYLMGAAALLLAGCGGSSGKLTPDALISTPQGQVQGVTTEDATIYNFKGIPYAAAPVDDLRWRAPQAAQRFETTFVADTFGARCMQPNIGGDFMNRLIDGQGLSGFKTWMIKRVVAAQKEPPMSEDCLFLNVRSGNLGGADKQPVMVWIHGGGHQFGSADTSYYQNNGLVRDGVVLVTINYRLGAFGYMAHPALSADDPNGVSGNYGALDQMAALRWVRDIISAYGGDPENVTIFGESAGAWSVTEMMASPLAEGLFDKAILESGSSTYHMIAMSDDDPVPVNDAGRGWPSGYTAGQSVAEAMGLSNPSAADLRALPADEIMANLPARVDDSFHHVRDGYVFPLSVGAAFATGQINAVPMLAGYNADEATIFYSNDSEPSLWIDALPRDDKAARDAALQAAYGSDIGALYDFDADWRKAVTDMSGDEIFGVNVRFAARQNAKAGAASYSYFFSAVPPSPKQTLGAYHASEIPYVFGSAEPALGQTDEDKALSEAMIDYWTSFAKTGVPSAASGPDWPEHQGRNWMHFSANTGRPVMAIEQDIRADKLDALDVGYRRKLDELVAMQTLKGAATEAVRD